MDSILLFFRLALLGAIDIDVFDTELKIYINTCLHDINVLGGPEFSITGVDETWTDYNELFTVNIDLNFLRGYILNKLRLLFDPPSFGPLIQVYQKLSDQYEFQIVSALEPQ